MNPIRVHLMHPMLGGRGYTWSCRLCRQPAFTAYALTFGVFGFGMRETLAQAADAGRAHYRRHHRQTAVIVGEHGPEIVKKEEAR